MDARLQQILDSKKHPISKAILRGLFEDENFKKYMAQRVEQLVCEKRGKLGYDMSNECWTWGEDEQLDEGIGSGLMHLVKTAATRSIGQGLGVSPSIIHGFTKHLTNRPKKVAAPAKAAAKPRKTKPAGTKPVHTNPAQASSHSVANMVLPSHVHSAVGKYPGEHETHLTNFINAHNKLITAKEKGDKSAARVHYLARNHHLAKYQATAPHAHLKHLNTTKVQQMMSIKE